MTLKRFLALACFTGFIANSQTNPPQLIRILQNRIQAPGDVEFELRRYLMGRIARLPEHATLQN
jgi:hypothetical protein